MPVGVQIVEKLRASGLNGIRGNAARGSLQLLERGPHSFAAERYDEYPSKYSGGMMQRAMIVDALCAEPAVLIADNVTQPLDVTIAAQIVRVAPRPLHPAQDGDDLLVVLAADARPVR